MENGALRGYKEFIFGNFAENSNYLVVLSDKDIKYLLFGDLGFKTLDSSFLGIGEAYIKQSGFGDVYDFLLEGSILKFLCLVTSTRNKT